MKIGFFGGTFDPIHFGHLNLALHILEIHKLDQVFFSPANFSPEKGHCMPKASKKARKEMVQLAIEKVPQFTLIDYELEREGPSFTINTIEYLKTKHPHANFYLILGGDIIKGLEKWKEIDRLLEIAPPLVGGRPQLKEHFLPKTIQKKILEGETTIPSLEISSTEIRERLSQKKSCAHLVPAKVLDYIEEHGLY